MKDAFAKEVAAQGDSAEIRAILEDVCHVTGMGFAAVARVTEERWIACQLLDKIEFGLKPGDELEIKTTICDDIRQCGQSIVIDHVAENFEWRTHPTPMLYGFESYASFPIFLGGAFWGTLCAIDPAPHVLSAPAIVAALEAHALRLATILQAADTSLKPAA
jgi:GAF domain-containing protein